MAELGFLRLSRKFFSHSLWGEDRVFSRAEAWLDLLYSASFSEGKKLIKGSFIEVPRGGIVATVRFLSDRWRWSNTKVCQYLDALRENQMITTEKRQGNTVILLCKYDEYNHQETTKKRRESDNETTTRRQKNDEIEEGKEGGERKDVGSAAEASPASKVSASKTDDQWLVELQSSEAYRNLNVQREAAKMRQWCIAHKKDATRRRFINWLNRADSPLEGLPLNGNGNHSHGGEDAI